MMERIPEPELMDAEVQARAYAEADFSEPHSRFVALVRESLPHLADAGAALDLGCGPGDVTRRFARAFPRWSVDGIDGSEPMLQIGREALQAEGLDRRVSLHRGHLPEARAPLETYDLVLSNAMIHHLLDPATLWQCVRRWAAPGAGIFVMDLIRPASREAAQAIVDRYAAGEPEILRHDFFHSLLAAYRVDEIRRQLRDADLGYLDVREVSDRHWAASGIRR